MGVIVYDVQVCVCKMINISAVTCLNVSKEHPYISSCLLFMSILYLCCPLFFWILIYSLPLAVCTGVVVSISGGWKRSDEGEKMSEDAGQITKTAAEGDHEEKRKKSFSRVRSVRRRRAKEIALEEEEAQQNAVAKSHAESNAVVEAVNGWKEQELYQDPELMRSLKLLKDEEDARDEANKVMEVGISEAERNKRLESLIERRRSRKMLSLQVRRSLLMNADAAATATATAAAPAPLNNVPAAPIPIPKINTWCSPGRGGGTFSPTPGSAPSIMIPMKNPFDLPYDPQEEKPDLTGDSFHQEFALGHNRDHTFCRHESFSLGPSQPMEFFDDRDDSSSIDNFGFRRRRGYHFSRPETDQESDTDFGPTEPESGQESESKSNTDSPDHDDDHIKEVIQVHGNAEDGEQLGTRANGQDELSLSSSSSSSSPASSDLSEDERPVRIINREAILKSLSMRRNSVDIDTTDQLQENNLSYANSALENASRLKQQYFAEKHHKRHGMTFSIASDMQVEVSEISSPPLTIDENMSHQDDASGYDGEMERNASWDGLDSWAGSSRVSETEDNEARPPRAHEVGAASRSKKRDGSSSEKHCIHSSSSTAELSDNGESQTTSAEETAEVAAVVENNVNNDVTVQRVEDEGEASSNEAAMDANDLHQERPLMQNAAVERVHQATISPKSVLQPTLSMASFEPDGDDEVQIPRAYSVDHSSSTAPQNSTSLVQFTVATSSNGDAQVSSGPSNAPTLGATDPESSYEKLKINQENGEKPKEVVWGSISQIAEIHESPARTRDESSSSRSLASNVEANDTDSVNQKLKIQENDEKLKGVANGCSSQALDIHETPAQTREESSSTNLTSAAKSAYNNEFVDAKLKIQENDQQPKKVDGGSSSSSISSKSNEKEMVIQESTHNDSTKTSSYEGHIGNSVSQEDTGHEHDLNKPEAHERETNSTTSNHLDGRKDEEVVDSDAGKSKGVISESFKKDEAGEEAEQHSNLHEAMPESINTLHS